MSVSQISPMQEQEEIPGIGRCEKKGFLPTPVEPCYLPSRNEGSKKIVSRKAVEVQVLPQSSLTRLPSQHDVTLKHVFQAAWALTLQRYVGSNTVSFGFLSFDSPETPASNGEVPIKQTKGFKVHDGVVRSIISTEISGNGSVPNFIRNMEVRSITWLECDGAEHPFNTVVKLQRRHQQSGGIWVGEDLNSKVGIHGTVTPLIDTDFLAV